MEMNVRDDKKLVEIWLTNAEKIDPVLREGLKEIYAKYKAKNTWWPCSSPARAICTKTRGTCCFTIDAAAPKRPCSRRKAASRGHGALNDGRRKKSLPPFSFLPLQSSKTSCTILSEIRYLRKDICG